MENIGPCVEWKGAKNSKGYAYTSVKHRAVRASRFFWEKVHGKIPDGLLVLHKCDNPACVNVNHFFLGTHADNMADMYQKGRAYNVKLTPGKAAAIRKAFREGETQKSIAARYGVTAHHLQRICTGKVWGMI